MPSEFVERLLVVVVFAGLVALLVRARDRKDRKARQWYMPESWKPEPRCQR